MYIQFLGTGDAFGSGGHFHTSFFLKTTRFSALIDCGASTPITLKQNKLTTDDIDVIFISHFHGDHYGGLPYLVLEAAKVAKRKKPLTIISPRGGKDRLQELLKLLYEGTSVLEELDINFLEYNGRDQISTSLFELKTFPVIHKPEALPHGFRISFEEKVVAFSGDTGITEVLDEIAEQADLFICECNFYQYQASSHLNYKTLAERAKSFTCKRMLLTHLSEEMLNHKDDLELETAKEGEKVYF